MPPDAAAMTLHEAAMALSCAAQGATATTAPDQPAMALGCSAIGGSAATTPDAAATALDDSAQGGAAAPCPTVQQWRFALRPR